MIYCRGENILGECQQLGHSSACEKTLCLCTYSQGANRTSLSFESFDRKISFDSLDSFDREKQNG